ncbi:DUF2304 domain-containing protein [Streptococcus suis]|nr:DUF2304 domain-containing protein [Streptococcus suis]
MDLLLQIEMIVLAIFLMLFIIRMVNHHSFSIKKAIPWILVGIFLIFISIFPNIIAYIAHQIGFGFTINFLLFAGLVFLFVLEISDTSNSAKKEQEIKALIQEVSLLKKEIGDKEDE